MADNRKKHSIKQRIDNKSFFALQDKVVDFFKVKNITQVKDKPDAKRFVNKYFLTSFSEVALQKILKTKHFSIEEKRSDIRYKPEFIVNGFKAELIAAELNEPFLIPRTTFDIAFFFEIDLFFRDVFIIGYLFRDDIMNNINANISPIQAKSYLGTLDKSAELNLLITFPNYQDHFVTFD